MSRDFVSKSNTAIDRCVGSLCGVKVWSFRSITDLTAATVLALVQLSSLSDFYHTGDMNPRIPVLILWTSIIAACTHLLIKTYEVTFGKGSKDGTLRTRAEAAIKCDLLSINTQGVYYDDSLWSLGIRWSVDCILTMVRRHAKQKSNDHASTKNSECYIQPRVE